MTEQLDLLHLDRALTPTERKRLERSTRSKKHGHAAPPGTGPKGETCGSCKHVRRSNKFFKCDLRRATWTHGYGTDVRARDEACVKWEQKEQADAGAKTI